MKAFFWEGAMVNYRDTASVAALSYLKYEFQW